MGKLKRVPVAVPIGPSARGAPQYKGLAVMAQPAENVSRSREFLDWAEASVRAAAPLMHPGFGARQGLRRALRFRR